jgi:hypothetical protein
MYSPTLVSIADLILDGVPIQPSEAVAVVRTLCALVAAGPSQGVPATKQVFIHADGAITVKPEHRDDEVTSESPVKSLATLLRSMLDRAPLGRGPSAELAQLVVCAGMLRKAAFESPDAFSEALAPFGGPDACADIRALFDRWAMAPLLAGSPEGTLRLAPSAEVIVLADTAPIGIRPKPDRRRSARVSEPTNPDDGQQEMAPLANLSERANAASGGTIRTRASRPAGVLAIAALVLALLLPTIWRAVKTTSGIPAAVISEPNVSSFAVRQLDDRQDTTSPTDASAHQRSPHRATRRPLTTRGATTRVPDAQRVLEESVSFDSDSSPVFVRVSDGVSDATMQRADDDLRVMRIIDGGAQSYNMTRSPDGRAIAFDSDRDGVRGVYVVDSTGTHVRRVSGDGFAALPTWSPDGTRLAFIRTSETDQRVSNVWVLDLASHQMHQVTFHPSGRTSGASWFPDGERLCYAHGDRVYIIRLTSARERELTLPERGRIRRTPVLSPDGQRVVVQVAGDGTWLLDLERGGFTKIIDDATAEAFAWAGDSRRLAYHSRRDDSWVMWVAAR